MNLNRSSLNTFHPQGVRYVCPEGTHDDLVMAMALAVKRMPWKLKTHMTPTGIPQMGGSKWASEATGDDEAGRRYQESLKPTQQSSLGQIQTEEEALPAMPTLAGGGGNSRWTEAG